MSCDNPIIQALTPEDFKNQFWRDFKFIDTWLVGSTGGYIFGYFFAAFIVGKLFETKKFIKDTSLIILFGHMIVLFSGWIYLSFLIGMQKAFLLGVLPFIATDVLKSIAITKLVKFSK